MYIGRWFEEFLELNAIEVNFADIENEYWDEDPFDYHACGSFDFAEYLKFGFAEEHFPYLDDYCSISVGSY